MYIDTHLHLSKEDNQELEETIKRAEVENVKRLIISGCDKKGIKESLEIAKEYDNVYLTLGYHPSEVETVKDEDIDNLKNIIINNYKVVAIGEIGLDYYWVNDNKEKQKALFRRQLDLAKELNLPVVIHSRDAYFDTYNILKEYNLKGVIHCFSGSIEAAREYIKLGYLLGIGGVVTFQNSKLKEVLKEITIENIVLETDSPYLSPTPYRGKPNEPKNIPIIAEEIASIKNILLEEVEKATTTNTYQIYTNLQ